MNFTITLSAFNLSLYQLCLGRSNDPYLRPSGCVMSGTGFPLVLNPTKLSKNLSTSCCGMAEFGSFLETNAYSVCFCS